MWKHKSLVALNFSVFFLMVGVGMIVALLPQKIITLSNSLSHVGYLASAFAVTYVVVQLPIGRLSDIFGFKKFIISGYFICAFTGILYYYGASSCSILIGRMIQGLGEAPIWASVPALISVLYPSRKGRYMGIYNASIHTGLMTGSLLSILVLQTWQGNEAFLFFALLSASGGLILFIFLENIVPVRSAKKERMINKKLFFLIKNTNNAIVLYGITLYGAGYGIFITLIPVYLMDIKEYTQTSLSLFFTIFYVAISIAQIIAGPLCDKKGELPIMCSGLIMTVIGMGLFIISMRPCFINSFLFLASLGLGVFCISSMTFLNGSVSKELKGTVSGAFYLFWGIGFFFGPMILGRSDTIGNFEFEIIVLACVFLVEAFILFLLMWKNKGKCVKAFNIEQL